MMHFAGKHVLLLQGPVGPFFRRLARDLECGGATVTRVVFNGGDWLFAPPGAVAYRGTPQAWPAYLERLVEQGAIDVILLFGDCRPVHRAVHRVAAARAIDVGVFEEGYVRPDYITFERHGVNARSRIPRDPGFYRQCAPAPTAAPVPVGAAFWHAAWWALLYYLAAAMLAPWFRHYRHHRPLGLGEALPWLRGGWRKLRYAVRERALGRTLSTTLSGQYFLVPLQVGHDAQMRVHSPFASVAEFIAYTVASFARHAPPGRYLVVKHHPMDRGYHDHARLIARLARTHQVEGRILYLHDQHLPTLLAHACGVVLVNSTVGMSALDHGAPVKVCGAALYDLAGLTFQASLARFWREAGTHRIDTRLYARYRAWLVEHTQINGSFYRRRGARHAPRSAYARVINVIGGSGAIG